MAKNNTLNKIFIFLGVLVSCTLIYGGFWFLESYSPDDAAIKALESNERVTVIQADDYILFQPNAQGSDILGLMYYPGAKVDFKAYAVMANRLASEGVPVVLVRMPFNFAFFDIDRALMIIESLDLQISWAIGGHSLGGAMASELIYKYPEQFSALILFASYSNKDLSNADLKIMSIWGTKDAFVTEEKINEKKYLLPANTIYAKIEGGNHSQFGNYGFQKGDQHAMLSSDMQINQIVEYVLSILKP